MDNIQKILVQIDKSLLYNLGIQLGSDEEAAKRLAESGQSIELTIIINPIMGEAHIIGVNDAAVSKAVKI